MLSTIVAQRRSVTRAAELVFVIVVAAFPLERAEAGDAICRLPFVDRATARSAQCLACHDGSIAPAVHATMASPPFEGLTAAPPGDDGRHPVEVDYATAELRRPTVLAPPAAIDSRLVLSDGKVTCATCHDGRSPLPAHVAVTLDRSALCLSCHASY